MGADMFLRSEVVDKLGLFDPSFFMYYEESELQYRYSKMGYRSMIVSGPEIVHLECASSKVKGKKYTYKQRRIFFESLFLYMKKRYSKIGYYIFRLIFLFQAPIFFANYYSFKEKLMMLKFITDFRR
jgi:GT2 family glycosyltransferase